MFIALLSVLISSIALVGIAISLLLQARQLRASQVQASAASHAELMKFALENTAAAMALISDDDPEIFAKEVALNWHISHLLMSYNNKTLSEAHLRRLVGSLFATEDSRSWWTTAGPSYDDDATSRRERRFFAIVDAEFQQASQMSKPAVAGNPPPDKQADSPPTPS
jgi:hypothetical protein